MLDANKKDHAAWFNIAISGSRVTGPQMSYQIRDENMILAVNPPTMILVKFNMSTA